MRNDFDAHLDLCKSAENPTEPIRRPPWRRRPQRCWPYIWTALGVVIGACYAVAVAVVWLSQMIF
jgi:hypothetical protein